MLRELYETVKSWTKKTLLVGATAAAMYLPGEAAARPPDIPTPRAEYTVQEGDNLYDIAERRLGSNTTLADVVEETNHLAELNGKGTIEEYPYTGEPCGENDEKDPNCIYPGEKLKLMKTQESVSSPNSNSPATPDTNPNTPLPLVLGLAGIAGLAGVSVYAHRKDKENKRRYLEDLVKLKNENPYATVNDLVEETNVWPNTGSHLQSLYTGYLEDYTSGQARIERYDHSIAPDEMKKEMVDKYRNSEMSLEQLSIYLKNKYGMNVSSSTISRRAREELKVDSREEARDLEDIVKEAA